MMYLIYVYLLKNDLNNFIIFLQKIMLSRNINKETKKNLSIVKDITKSFEFTNFYHNDNELFRVINNTKRMKKNRPYIEEERDLKSSLIKIKKEIQFNKTPEVQHLKIENDEFSKQYKQLNKKNLGPEDTFREIIGEYKEKGYKIPNLTIQHNLFQINPLIESDNEKLTDELYSNFLSLNRNENKGKNLAMKSMLYLKKIKNIVETKLFYYEQLKKNGNKSSIIRQETFTMPVVNIKNNKSEGESRKEILEKIHILLELIKAEPLKDYKTYHYNKTPKTKPKTLKINSNSPNKYPNIFQNIKNKKINTLNFYSNKEVSETYKKLGSNDITKNKKVSDKIFNKLKSISFLLSDSQVNKNNETTDSNIDKKFIPKSSRNVNNSVEFKSLNIEAQLIGNKIENDSYTNRGFNSTYYTNNTSNNFYVSKEKNLLQNAYENLVNDNFKKAEVTLRNYLSKAKGYNEETINTYLEHYTNNNMLKSITDLKNIIIDKKIRKNTQKIYLNQRKIQRVRTKLQKMYKEENIIKNLDKQYVKLYLKE